MAILNDGPNGGFRGKVGSIYGYQSMGKWIIRGAPKPSTKNKKGTVKQKLARAKFTALQSLFRMMIGYIRAGFALEALANNYTAHNAAKSYNMRHAFNAEGQLVYGQVRMTSGNLAMPENVAVVSEEKGLRINWKDNSNDRSDGPYVSRRDQVMILAYCAEKDHANYTTGGAKRYEETDLLEIPYYKGRAFHVWVSFVQEDRQNISNSHYAGEHVI